MKIDKIHKKGKLTIGLELPLDNDWSISGEHKRKADGRPFGVPDISDHAKHATLADRLGFSALWMRDVPVYDPSFGDAAQLFEVFSYLGYLTGITKQIMLGTAAVVLPLREPLLVAKSAASIDVLSKGRLLLGLGLGDRAIEFPLFQRDYGNRAQRFRDSIEILHHSWKTNGDLSNIYKGLSPDVQVFPKPINNNIPLVMAGFGQQSIEWIAENMDAWFNYPRSVSETHALTVLWNNAIEQLNLKSKPYITAFHLDLLENPDAEPIPHKFGSKIGRNKLIDLLMEYQKAGVSHMAIHLRKTQRPIEEVITEIGEYILPLF